MQQKLKNLCSLKELNESKLTRLQSLALNKKVDINHLAGYWQTALLLICRYNQSETLYVCLQILLQNNKLDVNAVDSFGQTALALLCRYYSKKNLIDCSFTARSKDRC